MEIEKVIRYARRFETELGRRGATGTGLYEKTVSIAGKLDPRLVSDLKRVAQVRNPISHEDGVELQNSEEFFTICHRIELALDLTPLKLPIQLCAWQYVALVGAACVVLALLISLFTSFTSTVTTTTTAPTTKPTPTKVQVPVFFGIKRTIEISTAQPTTVTVKGTATVFNAAFYLLIIGGGLIFIASLIYVCTPAKRAQTATGNSRNPKSA